MTYQVIPEQYARLVDARDHWPDHLTRRKPFDYWNDPPIPCAVAYLGLQAGLHREDIDVQRISTQTSHEISQIYGIPEPILLRWVSNNDSHLFGSHRRAKKMRRAFEKFLDEVEVVVPGMTVDVETGNVYADKEAYATV